MDDFEELRNKIIENWIAASKSLNFRLITPFIVDITETEEKTVAAFLPDYGSKNGMIFDFAYPGKLSDQSISNWAKENSVFLSYLYIESYQEYSEKDIRATIEDWGYYAGNQIRLHGRPWSK